MYQGYVSKKSVEDKSNLLSEIVELEKKRIGT